MEGHVPISLGAKTIYTGAVVIQGSACEKRKATHAKMAFGYVFVKHAVRSACNTVRRSGLEPLLWMCFSLNRTQSSHHLHKSYID